ncbi:DUF1802 family protein [Synoicihabitans lomoniglobus]|uniref:DUF1802 family protein n=1 Tax=Synoicihabitans lomoniglobus TaxID=2909285 RepID=A0AAF0I4N3_9BACT|nr:DUF1802 family protein [Opitutaceae bacterium LMO-M01]WED66585.1 DUF1802 family protein [Opitutaceae bacterium LMO-M01]
MFPAFKEWHAIVGALVAGEQSIILRKGGIAEGRGGFTAKSNRFWLLPTRFHAQAEKLKPAADRYLPSHDDDSSDDPPEVSLNAFAELTAHRFLTAWSKVAALNAQHLWTESTVRERFDWSKPPGIHLLTVQVHRLLTPVKFRLTAAQAGCKSWVELPLDFAAHPSVKVTPTSAPH